MKDKKIQIKAKSNAETTERACDAYVDESKELALLEETDREILLLFSNGYSDSKIAEKLGKSRFWVLRRRNALFARLKEKLEKS